MPRAIPFLKDAILRQRAEEVLKQYQPEAGIPVPIEEIIEFGLGVEIQPVPGLRTKTDIEGALTADLKTILVDEDCMVRAPNRYRFTLAHELGHLILHGDFLATMAFENPQEWKTVIQAIDAKAYGRMEHQGYRFAGYLLVPTESLRISCQEARAMAMRRGIDLSAMGSDAIGYVAGYIAKEYLVSTEVVERRIAAERFFREEA